VTDGLGENAAGALNALVPVPASGGGRRPCARGLSIHASLFSYSTVAIWSRPVGSHDALSVFEAVDVDTRACGWGASGQGPQFTYGCSRHVRQLGYPLLIPSTVAPESLFECLRSGRGSSYWSRFRGVSRATPRG